MRPRLLMYCQHSLGLGHLKRSWALARSLTDEFAVTLVSGGERPRGLEPPSEIDVVELPALFQHADGSLDAISGQDTVDAIMSRRTTALADIYDRLQPDAVVIELFPFGRRKFKGELAALLARTRLGRRPVVATSVRDLLVDRGEGQQKHDDGVSALLDEYFDVVLVHSDARFATLSETFRPSSPPRVPVHHTGFVIDRAPAAGAGERRPRVLVSGGGGRFAAPLYLAAIEAHRRLRDEALPMTVVAGPLCRHEDVARLRAAADGCDVDVVATVENLVAEMRRSTLSISQCGYNTALDILAAGVPALVVPFAENGDSEQSDRAARLERLGAVRVLRFHELSAETLAAAVRSTLRFEPEPIALDTDGAAASTRILKEMVENRPAPVGPRRTYA